MELAISKEILPNYVYATSLNIISQNDEMKRHHRERLPLKVEQVMGDWVRCSHPMFTEGSQWYHRSNLIKPPSNQKELHTALSICAVN